MIGFADSFSLQQDVQSVPLSPIRAAAYERVNRHNAELSGFVSKLTQEKAELRNTLANLEEQVAHYREREDATEKVHYEAKCHIAAFAGNKDKM